MSESDDPLDKVLMEAAVRVLSLRKGFGWWWEGIGQNRSAIRQEMRREFVKILKADQRATDPVRPPA